MKKKQKQMSRSRKIINIVYLIAAMIWFARTLQYAASPEVNIALDRAQAEASRPR